ncbi:MAG TPA: hypothetical protein VEU62_20415 [Bryobacterales bacterium]|nr:hypothetical protein [Bryobacterales bacterium]
MLSGLPRFAAGQSAARPVRRLGASKPAAAPRISFLSVDFQELRYGHEGPSYFPIKGEPSAGAQQLVEVSLYGQESIAAVKFEVLDEGGNVIQTLHLLKMDNSPENGEYLGLVDVPQQPFRIATGGQDFNGAAFRKVHARLFRPADRPLPALALPPGMPAANAQQIKAIVDAYEQQMRSRLEEARRAYPDGMIPVSRTGVQRITYEPFVSPSGHVLGMRIRYDIQFSTDGVYRVYPHVWPLYAAFRWRGEVTMKVQDESIDPPPEALPGSDPRTLLRYSVPAQYKGGVVYHVTADLVPDYVIYNTDHTRACIYNYKFQPIPGRATAWAAIKAADVPVKYRVDLEGADFQGETDPFFPQRAFYENFLREGAQDCGSTPTTRF